MDQKSIDGNKPITEIISWTTRGGREEVDSNNDALDLLMAASLRAKHRRDHGIFERENSRMSVESVFNRGWSLKSWDGSFCSSDIRRELERGLSHMTM